MGDYNFEIYDCAKDLRVYFDLNEVYFDSNKLCFNYN